MQWVDYAGRAHTSRECWEYVTGPARRKEGCTPGVRDAENEGKTPDDFLRDANVFIAARRWRQRALGSDAPDASSSSADDDMCERPAPASPSSAAAPRAAAKPTSMMADEHALLTLDEVLAVRLYSGPAFQPLNSFLRQIATLHGATRTELARHSALTFAATVGHVCSAIRKLAAVATASEARAPVFRGVRGALPKGFFEPDAHGAVGSTGPRTMALIVAARPTLTCLPPCH